MKEPGKQWTPNHFVLEIHKETQGQTCKTRQDECHWQPEHGRRSQKRRLDLWHWQYRQEMQTVAHRAREEGQTTITSISGNQSVAKGLKEDRVIKSGNQHWTGAREELKKTPAHAQTIVATGMHKDVILVEVDDGKKSPQHGKFLGLGGNVTIFRNQWPGSPGPKPTRSSAHHRGPMVAHWVKWPRILGTTTGWIQSCKGHCKMKWGTKTKNSEGLQPKWVNRWPEKCVTRFQWQCQNQASERTKVDYNSEYHKANLVVQTTGEEDLRNSFSFIQQIKIPHTKGQMCIKD